MLADIDCWLSAVHELFWKPNCTTFYGTNAPPDVVMTKNSFEFSLLWKKYKPVGQTASKKSTFQVAKEVRLHDNHPDAPNQTPGDQKVFQWQLNDSSMLLGSAMFDVRIVNSLAPSRLQDAYTNVHYAGNTAADEKIAKHRPRCEAVNLAFLPLIFYISGSTEKATFIILKRLTHAIASHTDRSLSVVTTSPAQASYLGKGKSAAKLPLIKLSQVLQNVNQASGWESLIIRLEMRESLIMVELPECAWKT